MCPVCISTAALIITGATSTGGLTAIAAKLFSRGRTKNFRNEWANSISEKGRNDHGNQHNEALTSGLAGRMAGRSKGVSDQGEGVHATAR